VDEFFNIARIAQNNGWAMAGAGACIVITGLSVLSFIISKLHTFLDLFESKTPQKTEGGSLFLKPEKENDSKLFLDIGDLTNSYKPEADNLGSAFELRDLYRAALEAKLPNPHLAIRTLREEGLLVSNDAGQFSWK